MCLFKLSSSEIIVSVLDIPLTFWILSGNTSFMFLKPIKWLHTQYCTKHTTNQHNLLNLKLLVIEQQLCPQSSQATNMIPIFIRTSIFTDSLQRAKTSHYKRGFYTIFATVKIICFILSLSVLVLSAVPCCADDYCNDELKTEQSCTEHQDRNDHNDYNGCSPFITCGTCTGFTFAKTDYNFQPITRVQSKFILYQQGFDENYFVEIWQPPKLS